MARNRRRGEIWRLLRDAFVGAARAVRWRFLRLRRLLVLAGAAALLVVTVRAAWNAARRSPYFLIRQIDVGAVAHVDGDELVRMIGLDRPTSIFAFDASAAERTLATHPWIQRVTVEKHLPDAVRIEVTPRVPAAVVAMSGLYLVDAAGQPFVHPEPEQVKDLPLITGLTRPEYEADPEGSRARLVTAMSLARLYQATPMAASRPLGSVHLAPGERYELMLGRTRVSLGRDEHRRKLMDLARVLEKLKSRNMDAAYILLDEAGQRAIVKEIPVETAAELPAGSLTMHAEGVKH
jgi:cell division septal protein FtsQ